MTPNLSAAIEEVRVYNTCVCFDDMSWPRIGAASDELEWRLRNAPEQVTRTDLLQAASYIASYRALVTKTQRNRNYISKQVARAERIFEK